MAKIDESTLSPDVTAASRKRFSVHRTRQGAHVQAWPKPRGHAKSGYRYFVEREFALAASWAANPAAYSLVAATSLARGSDEVPRDLIMRSSYGTLYEFILPDGTIMPSYRMVAPNAQLVLDQVTDEPGALLWRAPFGWIHISPGNQGEVLTYGASMPQWLPAGGGAGGPSFGSLYGLLNPTAGSAVNSNVVSGIAAFLEAGTIIKAANVYAIAASATTKLAAAIYGRTGNVPGPRLAFSAQQTGVVQGSNKIPFDTPFTVTTTDLYFIGLHTAIATWSQATHNGTVWGWGSTTGYPPPDPLGAITSSFGATFPKIWLT